MKKIILWSIVSLVIAGVAIDAFLWLHKPQIIKLPDGSRLTLIGATYGKHHVAPKIKIGGKLTRGNGAQLDSPDNALVVWIEAEHKANEYPNYQLMVYDKANTACVGTYQSSQSQINNKIHIIGYMFNAYPRWDRSMIVRVLANGSGGQRVAKEQFVVANPKRVSVPKWTPEPLPDTQSDNDLSVTLTKFVCGVPGFNSGRGVSAKDPMNKAVLAAFRCEQNGAAATNWQPVRIETSDASGNHAQNYSWSSSRDQNGDATMTYQWGLWPDRPWKLRVEMSQTAGFSNDELWSITNLPVNPGSQQDLWNYDNNNRRIPPAFAETTLAGIHLKIYPVIQFTNQMSGNGDKPGGFRVQADKALDGMQLTLVKAEDENGRRIPFYGGSGSGGNSRQIQLQNLRNAKSLNITLAIHKSRFVEFTAAPAKP
jgi:hypothetical protein